LKPYAKVLAKQVCSDKAKKNMKGQSMLSMLQKIILLEMACLDMEAKLSTSCRMVKAMSFLSYQ
jgi:hypothetical protein